MLEWALIVFLLIGILFQHLSLTKIQNYLYLKEVLKLLGEHGRMRGIEIVQYSNGLIPRHYVYIILSRLINKNLIQLNGHYYYLK